jgi:mono/diheme cytochrome c family protein
MYVRVIVAVGLIGLVVTGCAGPQPLPEAPTPIPSLIPATLPAVTVMAGAEGVLPEAVAEALGQELWDTNCVACHSLTSEQKVGPGLAGLWARTGLPSGNPFNEENLSAWIKAGGGAMPGFGSLSDEELGALVNFLKDATAAEEVSESMPADVEEPQSVAPTQEPEEATAQPAEEPVAVATAPSTEEPEAAATATAPPTEEPEAKPGDTPQVATAPVVVSNETFDTVCFACHNLTSEQKVGPGLAGLFDREELPSGKPVNDENLIDWIHTGGGIMPGFPNIEGEQLDSLVGFLKEATKQ